MTLAVTLTALVGATLVVVRSTLFGWLQRLYTPLFHCSQCSGFWVGAAAGGAGVVTLGHGRVLDALLVGCATSFLSMAADAALLNLLGDPEH